jgi:hypothetical protein
VSFQSVNIICELEERVKLEIIARLEKQGQEVAIDDVDLSDAYSDAGSRYVILNLLRLLSSGET